ncbi:hypothetical protein STIAU_5553 [Stigmatella aurantiaca DW4/3-1]|uniref:Uncharacterized protein n=1 Tax=Stigmatella aurantiaca (strain DW4/3-1) TaxID=378806 RepID=Q09DX2_STIAD|nr:hypothetical protein STIAU_5553 [Stigmatella aurantiaca DW4/3-1]
MWHELRDVGKLWRVQRLLRYDRDAVTDGDGFHLRHWDVQPFEHHLGDAGVHACGA